MLVASLVTIDVGSGYARPCSARGVVVDVEGIFFKAGPFQSQPSSRGLSHVVLLVLPRRNRRAD
jgi:hypothetical protein